MKSAFKRLNESERRLISTKRHNKHCRLYMGLFIFASQIASGKRFFKLGRESMRWIAFKPSFSFDGSHAPCSCSSNSLSEYVVLAISTNENALDIGCRAVRLCEEIPRIQGQPTEQTARTMRQNMNSSCNNEMHIPVFIHVQLCLEWICIGNVSNGQENSLQMDFCLLVCFQIHNSDSIHLFKLSTDGQSNLHPFRLPRFRQCQCQIRFRFYCC